MTTKTSLKGYFFRLEDYCSLCPNFEAEVEPRVSTTDFVSGCETIAQTVITCKNFSKCRNITRYLTKVMTDTKNLGEL